MQRLIYLSILSPAVASSECWWRNVTPQTHTDPLPEYSPKPQMCGWGTSQCNQNEFISSINFSSCLWSFTTSSGEELHRLNRLWVSCHLQVSAAASSQFLYWEKRWTTILCLPFSAHFIFITSLLSKFFSSHCSCSSYRCHLCFVGSWLKY